MFGLGMSTYGNLTNASMAYLPYMPYNPFGITNFGGDIQIFPVEPYGQSQIGLVFNQVAQMSGWPMGLFGGYQMTPQINMSSVVSQASAMAAQSLNQLASQEINAALQTIAGQKAKIQAQLQAKDLKDEDKAKLEEQLKKLEEYEKEIEAIKTSGMDPQSAYLKANELKVAVNNLIAGKTDTTSSEVKATDTAKDEKTNDTSDQKVKEEKENKGKEQGLKSEKLKAETPWVDAMHDAMWGLGTSELFDAGCSDISKDNVIERMVQWNNSYPNESFMEAFMADADYSQKRNYGRIIYRALRDKAQELGIDLTKDKDYQQIQSAMEGNWNWLFIDNGVADNYNAVIKKLAQKMGYKYNYAPYTMSSK